VVQYIINKRARKVCTDPRAEMGKEKHTDYLSIQAEKGRKGNLIVMFHSVCLEESLLNNLI
jgi:hypothetical protein